ncbi:hypothetical protein AB0C34_03180 [Nocardia sp. NPDC049220]|uniref:hypothetical protein n=1 Tax=Nocardia sp. NPDC049220 TaxID=3155273 RepID=UPI0033E171A3
MDSAKFDPVVGRLVGCVNRGCADGTRGFGRRVRQAGCRFRSAPCDFTTFEYPRYPAGIGLIQVGTIMRILIVARDRIEKSFARLVDICATSWRNDSNVIKSGLGEYLNADATMRRVEFLPSDAERAIGNIQFRRLIPIVGEGRNGTYKVVSSTGMSIYKPAIGENVHFSMKNLIPQISGELAKREVAAYRVNELLGFTLVPPTAIIKGPKGLGSNQNFVHSEPATSIRTYDSLQSQQMAVLDYIIGNLDRPLRNFRVTPNGDLVAIDHGYSFPENQGPPFISSHFVDKFRGQPLDRRVLESVDAVDPGVLRQALRELDLGDKAIDGAIARLKEIQTERNIVGKGWLPDTDFMTWGIQDAPRLENKKLPPG